MNTKEAINVLIAHALCCLSDGSKSCKECPASNELGHCDNDFTNDERLREAVNIVNYLNN